MDNKVEIFCSLEIEGTHNWLECPLEEVSYLRYEHRHRFGIKAYKRVAHLDRSTEFIVLKHEIIRYVHNKYYCKDINLHRFSSKSCEMIGLELLESFNLSRIEVNEDGENGAIVYAIEINDR